MISLRPLLETFDALCAELSAPQIPRKRNSDFSQPLVLSLPGCDPVAPRTLVIGLMIHGNECGPLAAVVPWLLEKVQVWRATGQSPFADAVVVFVANAEAGLRGLRFVDRDLNRMFGEDAAPGSSPRDPLASPLPHEATLVPVLRTVLSDPSLALFVDLHQTIEATERAFFTFGYHGPSVRWAHALAHGVTGTLVTRAPGTAFVHGQLSSDEYVRAAGVPGLTLELGQKGFHPETTQRTHALLANLKRALEHRLWVSSPQGMPSEELRYLCTRQRLPFDGPKAALRPGLKNFSECSAGQILGTTHSGQPLVADQNGYLLFPKYPTRDPQGHAAAPLPADIVNIANDLTPEELHEWVSGPDVVPWRP